VKKLEKLTQLQEFGVFSDGVTDVAIHTIIQFQELRVLAVGSSVTDAGLAKLAMLPKLNVLWLDGNTRVTDAGLDHFAKCKELTNLYLSKTGVTKAGVEKLAKALPNCRIEYDGGTIEPKK
jgi:hypothetical protein